MPALVFAVVALVCLWLSITVIGGLFHPIWKPCMTLLDKLAAPVAGAVEGIEEGARELGRNLREPLASSARSFLYGDTGCPHPGWPWRCVIKPFLSLAIAVYVIVIEFDLGALAWQVKFHTGPVPDLHLPLSLLMGMMWPIVAVAWGDALFDIVDRTSIGPWAPYPRRVKAVIAVVLGSGLVAGVVGNMLFFVWRGGQLENVNPYTNLSAPINLLLGGLLFLSPVLAGAVGLRFLTILVPLVLAPLALVLLVLEKAAHVTRLAIEAVEAAAKVVLLLFNSLGAQLIRVVEAVADAIIARLKSFGDERTPRRRTTQREPKEQLVAQQPGPGFGSQVGTALLEGTRSFWSLTDQSVRGVGRGVLSLSDWFASFVRALFGACVSAIAALGRGARWLAISVGEAFGILGNVIAIVAVTLWRVIVALVRPVVILVIAVVIWAFYLPLRVRWSLVAWLCRFDFFKSTMKFRPLPDPPPKKRMEWRLNRLGAQDQPSGILISTPPVSAPPPTGESDLAAVADNADVVEDPGEETAEPLDPPAALGG
jgi:hypothetical protein